MTLATTNTRVAADPHHAKRRAVIYLRVSTARQAQTDRDDEGFSIPTQRETCYRKAEDLGAEVVDEYVDAGESARSVKRPELQRLLSRLKHERDVDYVIVFKVDRLARNRTDDVLINLDIQQAGAQLVSVSENIDETPSGTLLHGIMASMAEFYSANLSHEVSKKMAQKAKKGGTPGRAPLGYLNVREIVDGKEIRTVTVDPVRAPMIQWAFEAYGTGRYTVRTLADALGERGLTTRATAKQNSRPVTINQVSRMLNNTYYIGYVTFAGVQHRGSHEPLVDLDTFTRVQAVLATNRAGEKQRKYPHY